jgi:hypothetical protein
MLCLLDSAHVSVGRWVYRSTKPNDHTIRKPPYNRGGRPARAGFGVQPVRRRWFVGRKVRMGRWKTLHITRIWLPDRRYHLATCLKPGSTIPVGAVRTIGSNIGPVYAVRAAVQHGCHPNRATTNRLSLPRSFASRRQRRTLCPAAAVSVGTNTRRSSGSMPTHAIV